MNKKFLFVICALILATLACQLPFLGNEDVKIGIPDLETESFSAAVTDSNLLAPVPLSPAQAQVIGVHGRPNRFMILYSNSMREETWFYDHLGFEITFRNGEIFSEREREPLQVEMDFTSSLFPWQFNREMNLNALIAVTESESFAIESLDGLVEGEELSIIYLKGMDAGMREGKVVYVRAIPIENAVDSSQRTAPELSDPTSGDSKLTIAEQSHAGVHDYRVSCTYSDGPSEEYEEAVSWEFKADGLYYGGDGPFPKVDVNFYGLTDEDDEFYFYFQDNVVTLTAKFFELSEEGERTSFSAACIYTLK